MSEISVSRTMLPLKALEENSSLPIPTGLPMAPSVPWLMIVSLRSLPLSSHRPCVSDLPLLCLIRTLVIGFTACSESRMISP